MKTLRGDPVRQGNGGSFFGKEKNDNWDFKSTVLNRPDPKPPVVIEYVMKTVTRKITSDVTALPIISGAKFSWFLQCKCKNTPPKQLKGLTMSFWSTKTTNLAIMEIPKRVGEDHEDKL